MSAQLFHTCAAMQVLGTRSGSGTFVGLTNSPGLFDWRTWVVGTLSSTMTDFWLAHAGYGVETSHDSARLKQPRSIRSIIVAIFHLRHLPPYRTILL